MFSLNRKSPFHFQVNPVVVFVVIGCLWLSVSTTLVMAHSGGEVTSKKTPSPITIDGNLDEWASVIAESTPLQDIVPDPRGHGQDWYQIMPGSGADTNDGGLRVSRGRFDGDDDFSARWATLWDDDYLYVAFDVTDDSVHVYDRDYEVRVPDIDGVWLLFDTKHDAPLFEYPNHEFNASEVAGQSSYEADDLFWAFASITDRGAGTAWVSAADADPLLNDPANGHVGGQVTGTGYTAEIRLPWSVFEEFFGGPLVPEDGTEIGFDITFTDVDGDPPGTYAAPLGGAIAWSSNFENDNSPGVLGDLIISSELIGGGATSVNPTGKLTTTWGRIKSQR